MTYTVAGDNNLKNTSQTISTFFLPHGRKSLFLTKSILLNTEMAIKTS